MTPIKLTSTIAAQKDTDLQEKITLPIFKISNQNLSPTSSPDSITTKTLSAENVKKMWGEQEGVGVKPTGEASKKGHRTRKERRKTEDSMKGLSIESSTSYEEFVTKISNINIRTEPEPYSRADRPLVSKSGAFQAAVLLAVNGFETLKHSLSESFNLNLKPTSGASATLFTDSPSNTLTTLSANKKSLHSSTKEKRNHREERNEDGSPWPFPSGHAMSVLQKQNETLLHQEYENWKAKAVSIGKGAATTIKEHEGPLIMHTKTPTTPLNHHSQKLPKPIVRNKRRINYEGLARPRAKDDFMLFTQYLITLSWANDQPDVSYIMKEFFSLTNSEHIKSIENYLLSNKELINIYLASDDFSCLPENEMQKQKGRFSLFLFRSHFNPSFSADFRSLKNKYNSYKLLIDDFIDRMFKLEHHHASTEARRYIYKMNFISEYSGEESSFYSIEKQININGLKVLTGEMNPYDFFTSHKILTSSGADKKTSFYNMIDKVLHRSDWLYRDPFNEIILANIHRLIDYLRSEYFNLKSEAEKGEIKIKIIDQLKSNTLTKILSVCNMIHKVNPVMALVTKVVLLLNLFDSLEIGSASLYLSQNPRIIPDFKLSGFYKSQSNERKELISKKISSLMSSPSFEEIVATETKNSADVNIIVIERLISLFSEENISKAANAFLGNSSAADGALISEEYINLKKASLFIIQNIPLVSKYLSSTYFKKLNKKEKEQRVNILKKQIKKENRDLFLNAEIGVPLSSIFEDKIDFDELSELLDSIKLKEDKTEIMKSEEYIIKLLLSLPSVNNFMSHLKRENKTFNLSELFMLKNFILDAAKEGFLKDDILIDEAIEMYGIISKLEPIYIYKYQLLKQNSPMPDYIIDAHQERLEDITLGSIILKEINKAKKKSNTNTCDIEDILIPVLPTDEMIRLYSVVKQYQQGNRYSKLMDLAFRRHFLKETQDKFKNSALGRRMMLSRVFARMLLNSETTAGEKAMVGINAGYTTFYNGVKEGPFGTILYEVIFDDLISGRSYSSLTTDQIKGFLIGSTVWNTLSSIVPFYQSLREWMNLADTVIEETTGVCDYVRPLVSTVVEAAQLVGIKRIEATFKKRNLLKDKSIIKINKAGFSKIDLKKVSEISIAERENYRAEVVKTFSDHGYSNQNIHLILNFMDELNLHPKVEKVIVCESLAIDIRKRAELADLNMTEYAQVVYETKLLHPHLFTKQIFTITEQANFIRSELLSKGYYNGMLKGELASYIKRLDRDGVSITSVKLLLAERANLTYFDKLKFTKLDIQQYYEHLSQIAEHHPELLKELISKTEHHLSIKTSMWDLILDMADSIELNTHKLNELLVKYINANKKKFKECSSDANLLSVAELFGLIPKDLLLKFESEHSNKNNFFYKTLDKGRLYSEGASKIIGYRLPSLTDQQPYFHLINSKSEKHITFSKFNEKSKTKTMYLTKIPEKLLNLTYKEISENLYSLDLVGNNLTALNNWLTSIDVELRETSTAILKSSVFNLSLTNPYLYQDIVQNTKLAVENNNLVITSHGDTATTFTKAGIFNAESLADYLAAYHSDVLMNVDKVELKSPRSADGGIFSQSQTLANILNKPVIGYESESLTVNPIISEPISLASELYDTINHGNKKANIVTTENFIGAGYNFTPELNPTIFRKEKAVAKIINHELRTVQKSTLTYEIENMIKSDPKITNLINAPLGNCMNAASAVHNLLNQKEGISNIKIINMNFWNTANSPSSSNHYAVQITYKGEKLIVDPTANQFDFFGINRFPIVTTAENWFNIYQNALSEHSKKLVKIHVSDNIVDAYFTNLPMLAFEEIINPDVKILNDASWYNEHSLKLIINNNKRLMNPLIEDVSYSIKTSVASLEVENRHVPLGEKALKKKLITSRLLQESNGDSGELSSDRLTGESLLIIMQGRKNNGYYNKRIILKLPPVDSYDSTLSDYLMHLSSILKSDDKVMFVNNLAFDQTREILTKIGQKGNYIFSDIISKSKGNFDILKTNGIDVGSNGFTLRSVVNTHKFKGGFLKKEDLNHFIEELLSDAINLEVNIKIRVKYEELLQKLQGNKGPVGVCFNYAILVAQKEKLLNKTELTRLNEMLTLENASNYTSKYLSMMGFLDPSMLEILPKEIINELRVQGSSFINFRRLQDKSFYHTAYFQVSSSGTINFFTANSLDLVSALSKANGVEPTRIGSMMSFTVNDQFIEAFNQYLKNVRADVLISSMADIKHNLKGVTSVS